MMLNEQTYNKKEYSTYKWNSVPFCMASFSCLNLMNMLYFKTEYSPCEWDFKLFCKIHSLCIYLCGIFY